jgi:hypothetical protein
MSFEQDLFISYAHIDNQPLSAEQQGWVTRLHTTLNAMLSMRMGRHARIWRDTKLAGNDVFGAEIVAQFSKTAALVSIVSPRYVQSEWCSREAWEFCRAAEQSAGIFVENKARIFKVVKTPVDREEPLPPAMKSVLGYPFYDIYEDQVPLELDPAYGPEMAQKYNIKVAQLAWQIAQLIAKVIAVAESNAPAALDSVTRKEPAVYLAECSYDRRDDREAIAAELRRHGYDVFPDSQLPRDEYDYLTEVRRVLSRCALSVHVVGSLYGAVPDGPGQRSVVDLQNELAAEESRKGRLRRVIWVPEGTRSAHSAQTAFLQALHNDADAQFGADLITSDLEALKAAVHSALRRLQEPDPGRVQMSDSGSLREVCLICDERDRKATIPLRKFLKSRGLDVQLPIFEGDAATVRRANQEQLAQSDIVIVFYGEGDEAWKRSVDSDIRKSRGYAGAKPLLAAFAYLAPPASAAKNDLIDMGEHHLIDGLHGFSEEAMAPLLKVLSAGASA